MSTILSGPCARPGLVPVILLALVLAGCSGGDGAVGSAGAGTAVATANGQQPAAADAFIGRVRAVIGSTDETAAPVDIKSIPVTTPEQAAPVPL